MEFNRIFVANVKNPKLKSFRFFKQFRNSEWSGAISIEKGSMFYIHCDRNETVVCEISKNLNYDVSKPLFKSKFVGYLDAKNYLTDLHIRPISNPKKCEFFIRNNFQHHLDNI